MTQSWIGLAPLATTFRPSQNFPIEIFSEKRVNIYFFCKAVQLSVEMLSLLGGGPILGVRKNIKRIES